MKIQTNVFFCPQCGSASTETSELTGSAAACLACGWKGKKEALVVAPIETDLSRDEALEFFSRELRNVFAKHAAKEMGLILKKWGFVDGNVPQQVKLLGRYFEAMARSMGKAVFEERQKIEKESSHVV
jgi:hypothetical protein